MASTKTLFVSLAFFVLLVAATLVTTAQNTSTNPPVGQQTTTYCLISSQGSMNAAACLAKWNADPNLAALCPPNQQPVLDHCGMERVPNACATSAGTGQECYCKYKCVTINSTPKDD
ncbi:MAG: hypothetical protein AABY16_02310 [Nanoarchaeota archaeon]